MEWNAQLDWAEEVFTLLIVLPAPALLVVLLWYLAPRMRPRS